MPPSVMAQFVEDEIVGEIDMDMWEDAMLKEKEPQGQLLGIGRMWHARGSNFHADVVEALDDLDAKRRDEE